jgi:hypothetical protein
MVLMRFFKPKWQHSDPAVRRQAVAALGLQEMELLAQIAREDSDASVRRQALSRINDPEFILDLANSDGDSGVRESARRRTAELLCGAQQESPPLAARLVFLEKNPDSQILEHVALNGAEPELRLAAQQRVSRQALLREVAIKDAVAANRLAALERVTEPELLAAIMRASRKQDKQVYKLSKARLDAIREAEAHRVHIREACEEICGRLEAMGKGEAWEAELEELERLDERWQALEAEAAEQARSRFVKAREAFWQASESFRRAREAEERQWADSRAVQQGILDQLAQSLKALQAAGRLSQEEEKTYADQLTAWQSDWQAAPELPESQSAALNRRFESDRQAMRKRIGELRKLGQLEAAMRRMVDKAQSWLDSKKPVDEHRVKELEKRWKQQDAAGVEQLPSLAAGFEDRLKRLKERLHHQLEQRKKEFEKLPGMIQSLETQLKEKHLKDAVPLHDRLLSSLDHLQALGIPRDKLAPFSHRLHELTPQVRELQSWRSWGADEARERLCGEMEALIGSDQEPTELAKQIRHLRNEWNHMRSEGGMTARTLRKRFDKAASEAYKPCDAFYKQQAETRKESLSRKQALLQELQAYLDSAEWSHMDWKAAVKMQRHISGEWRQSGPVDRREARGTEKQYHQLMGLFNEHLELEHKRNLAERKGLIEKVRALMEVEDVHKALDACKELQSQWHTTVPGRRKDENAIWDEFRGACDAVFARRQQQQAERHEEQQQNRLAKEALCASLEQLAGCSFEDLHDAERQLYKLQDEWKEIGPVGKRESGSLDARYDKLRKAFHVHVESLRQAQAQAQLDLLRQKALLCRELEQKLATTAPVAADIDQLEARWSALESLTDDETEGMILSRFEAARVALREGEARKNELLQQLAANLPQRQELCLRMEIASGVESPQEFQQARMEFQTNRLAEAIGQGVADPVGELADLQRDWYLSGCAPAAEDDALQERFEKANRAAATKKQ